MGLKLCPIHALVGVTRSEVWMVTGGRTVERHMLHPLPCRVDSGRFYLEYRPKACTHT